MLRKTVETIISEYGCERNATTIRLYSSDDELVCIELTPAFITEDGNIFWDRYDSLTVYRTDCEKFLIPIFDEIFPVKDPDPNNSWGMQDNFDPCSLNWFGREDWLKIAELLRKRCADMNSDERDFCLEAAGFIERTADISGIFCIEGNL
ncbi:MAG: hypothetical protein E7494_16315 [Ruminococcus albus]|jgi:hypothetical protein|nr:hypothetical protein [Ruminococcus albus]